MNRLNFHRKPMPILAEYRPMYKIIQVLLILHLSSRGNKSSLIRLHLISWSMKDERRKTVLLESANKKKVYFGVWGVDPSVNFALQYSVAERLVEMEKTSYKLTNKGIDFITKIKPNDILDGDYEFLSSLGNRITESMVDNITEEWT